MTLTCVCNPGVQNLLIQQDWVLLTDSSGLSYALGKILIKAPPRSVSQNFQA